MLPPSQIQITLQLTNGDELFFYRTHAADEGRVIVTQLNLRVPRLIFNTDGYNLISQSYMTAKQ